MNCVECGRETPNLSLQRLGLRAQLDLDCNADFGTEPECDCPHEHWHIGAMAGACLDVHVEEDGSGHITLNAGDYDRELVVRGIKSLAEARAIAFGWMISVCSINPQSEPVSHPYNLPPLVGDECPCPACRSDMAGLVPCRRA